MRGIKGFSVACGVGLLIAGGPVMAQSNKEIEPLARSVVLPSDLHLEENRLQIVKAFATYCAALQNQFPTNSPAENAWLDTEINAGGERVMRVLRSSEFGRRSAANFTNQCLSATSVYLDNEQVRPQSVFFLIGAIARFAPDLPQQAAANGLDPERWGFSIVQSVGIGTLSEIGLIEANQAALDSNVGNNGGN